MDNQNTNMSQKNQVEEPKHYKFCSHCGAKIDAQAVVCPNCGVPVAGAQSEYNRSPEPDPSFGWAILGFFLPVIGWILYFVFKKDAPKRAHRCAVSAWWGFGISFVIGFIMGVAGA